MRRKKTKRIRIYELAKRLDISSRELLKELEEYGLDDVTSHMSTLDSEIADLVVAEYKSHEIETIDEDLEVDEDEVGKEIEVEVEEEIAEEEIAEEEKVFIQEGISVRQLGKKLEVIGTELVATLMKMGIMAGINQRLDYEALSVIANKFNFIPVKEKTLEERLLVDEIEEDQENLIPRAPVVTIMGHVDHGKTSLLDAVRDANVMDSEAGGITQHIGAYHVEVEGKSIVFIDTPGHEAFTAMRARGAKVTDIVVLVVAADDGVMPQTIEAIDHAKAAEVPIIIAINKIDKRDAKIDVTKRQLSEYNLMPEEWGGDSIFADISAKNREGIEYLLEMILLEAELLELTANPETNARGTVIEAQIDPQRGPVGTVLVQSGTLRVGDAFIAGLHDGKVRAMIDDKGENIVEARPSTPVKVLGFSDAPKAGDLFYALDDEKDAKAISESRQTEYRHDALTPPAHVNLANFYEQLKDGSIKELDIILKGDVQGSIQAISETLCELSTDEVKLNIIHQAIGSISETDVMLASASNAIVIGFNISLPAGSLEAAKRENVDIRMYNVIYELISDILAAMEGLLEPDISEVVLGKAVVRDLFDISSIGRVAGCYVTNGSLMRNEHLRVIRSNHVTFEGKLDSLRRFKDNVNEVASGYECGISLDSFNDFQIDDILECYTVKKTARRLRRRR